MKVTLALVAILCSAAASAQSAPKQPMVGDKPLVRVKLHKPAPAKPRSIAARLEACLDIDDGTKARLDCYDAVVKPEPKEKAPAAERVVDCRFAKEEDARLACFNGFVETMPKLDN
jgi:hypothetical protein